MRLFWSDSPALAPHQLGPFKNSWRSVFFLLLPHPQGCKMLWDAQVKVASCCVQGTGKAIKHLWHSVLVMSKSLRLHLLQQQKKKRAEGEVRVIPLTAHVGNWLW